MLVSGEVIGAFHPYEAHGNYLLQNQGVELNGEPVRPSFASSASPRPFSPRLPFSNTY